MLLLFLWIRLFESHFLIAMKSNSSIKKGERGARQKRDSLIQERRKTILAVLITLWNNYSLTTYIFLPWSSSHLPWLQPLEAIIDGYSYTKKRKMRKWGKKEEEGSYFSRVNILPCHWRMHVVQWWFYTVVRLVGRRWRIMYVNWLLMIPWLPPRTPWHQQPWPWVLWVVYQRKQLPGIHWNDYGHHIWPKRKELRERNNQPISVSILTIVHTCINMVHLHVSIYPSPLEVKLKLIS